MYCGGQGIYLHYLAREYQKMGHEVHVLAGPPYPQLTDGIIIHQLKSLYLYRYGDPPTPLYKFPLYKPINFYELVATRLGMFPEPLAFTIRAYWKLRALKGQFDIIHDNQSLGYGLLLMKKLGIPVVATIHHPIPIDKEADLTQARTRREKLRREIFYSFTMMQSIVSRRMDKVITVSHSSEEEIKRHFKLPESKMKVIYNGVDTTVFKNKDGTIRKPNTLIMVGNTEDRKKGVLYLLKALKLLKGQIDTELTIVDEAVPETRYAPRLAREFGLENMVTFTGRLTTEELAKRYSEAALAIAPSIYEGFGFPAAEAMSCRTPVIATTAGALPELVADGETGILVPPEDPYALAAAIERLLGDEPLQRKLGEAGRRRVERLFTWREAAQKNIAVYEEVLNDHS
jgi:glycosyltransferase involved in cell wall biosynthesis